MVFFVRDRPPLCETQQTDKRIEEPRGCNQSNGAFKGIAISSSVAGQLLRSRRLLARSREESVSLVQAEIDATRNTNPVLPATQANPGSSEIGATYITVR